MNEEIKLTQSAATRITAITTEQGEADLKLRVFIEGGGCSGMQYGFAFETQINEDDFTYNHYGVTLVVDSISHQYLLGAEIDFKDDKLNGSRFIIKNPSATGTCGCGSSFSA